MENTQEPTSESTPIWKQVLGAIGGALVALGLYTIYETAQPNLTAWLSLPWPNEHKAPTGEAHVADIDDFDAQEHIARKAKDIAERFATRSIALEADEEAPAPAEETPSYQSLIERARGTSASVVTEGAERSAPSEESPVDAVAAATDDSTDSGAGVENTVEDPSVEKLVKSPDELPSSGIGTWLIGIAAFLSAVGFRYRKVLHADIVRIG